MDQPEKGAWGKPRQALPWSGGLPSSEEEGLSPRTRLGWGTQTRTQGRVRTGRTTPHCPRAASQIRYEGGLGPPPVLSLPVVGKPKRQGPLERGLCLPASRAPAGVCLVLSLLPSSSVVLSAPLFLCVSSFVCLRACLRSVSLCPTPVRLLSLCICLSRSLLCSDCLYACVLLSGFLFSFVFP